MAGVRYKTNDIMREPPTPRRCALFAAGAALHTLPDGGHGLVSDAHVQAVVSWRAASVSAGSEDARTRLKVHWRLVSIPAAILCDGSWERTCNGAAPGSYLPCTAAECGASP